MRDNARTEWLTIGTKLVAAPGRKAIIHGEESLLFTRDSRDFVHDLGGKDIQIIAFPGARHHLMLDQPLAFVTAVRPAERRVGQECVSTSRSRWAPTH